jgi:uncharacterized membrane protein
MNERVRLLPIDAVRGIAMFFIAVSHISFYLINDSALLASYLRAIGFVATPNFLLMSGLACGYQLAAAPTTATALRILDRGLFAFLVGHLLVAGSLVYVVPSGTAFEHVVITDSIGILLCLAPVLRSASARALFWLGAGVYLLSSTLALAWHPTTKVLTLLGALLFAINDGDMPDVGWVTPTIPYLGIFLVGVGLGKLISCRRSAGYSRELDVRLAVAGSAAIVMALASNVARHFLKPYLLPHWTAKNWADVLLTTLNIRHDAPPTLGYALFYGGIGVALVGLFGLLTALEKRGLAARVLEPSAVIGRASLVSYVVQQWTIDFVPLWIGFDSWLTPVTAPFYLVLNTVLMYWVARIWGRHQGNRLMTLGLKPVIDPSQAVTRATTVPAAAGWPGGLVAAGARPGSYRVTRFAGVVTLVILLNLLALQNAAYLTPDRLALLPVNPNSWTPTRIAGDR